MLKDSPLFKIPEFPHGAAKGVGSLGARPDMCPTLAIPGLVRGEHHVLPEQWSGSRDRAIY